MQVYQSLSEYSPIGKTVVTVGTFDGVHFGHRRILSMLTEVARPEEAEVVLLTFHPHPRKVIFPTQPAPRMLNTIAERTKLLANLGVDRLIIEPFTLGFSKMEYNDFVKDVLVSQLSVDTLVIGYDHQFGRNRKGNINLLKELALTYNFKVIEIPEQDIENAAVSSTRIRTALEAGNVKEAASLLGYNYMLSGMVVQGKKIGREIGYPTANLQVGEEEKLIPANGVYVVTVNVRDSEYGGMLNIGTRPTFDDGERSIEVNLFDFNGDLYGQTIQLNFVDRIRDELKFDSVKELVSRIDLDKAISLQILGVLK